MAGDSVPVMVDDFDSWYFELRPKMSAALAVWCGDAEVAADALDEAFTRAVERWDRVRAVEAPAGWVWRTATNVIRRRQRRAALEARLLRRVVAAHPTSSPASSADDLDLRRALLTLTERQRTAIVLHYIADLSHRDVAEALGVAVGTVAATLHQSRRLLAERLAVPDGRSPRSDPISGPIPPPGAAAPGLDTSGAPGGSSRPAHPDGALP